MYLETKNRPPLALEEILQSSEDGFLWLDFRFCVTFANRSAAALLGLSETCILGADLSRLLEGLDAPEIRAELSTQSAFTGKFSLVRRKSDAPSVHLRVVSLEQGFGAWLRPAPATRERELEAEVLAATSAIEAAHLGTWHWNIDANDLHWSDRCRALFGAGRDESITVDLYRARIHPDDREKARRSVDDCLAHPGELHEVEYRVVWPDRSVHWLQSWKQARAGTAGKAALVTGAVVNIDQRKALEDDFRRTGGALRVLIDSSPMGIGATDAAGRITIWNPAAERILGFRKESVVGGSMPFPLPLDSSGHERETRVQRADGQEIEILCSVAPVDPRDPAAGFIAMFLDITERQRMRQQADQMRRMESLGVLAGGVAHDFNNLLTGIIGNASLCLYSLDDKAELQVLLQEVLKAGERAATLTRQLLAYAGKARFVAAPLNLSELARELAAKAAVPGQNKQIAIQFDLESHIPLVEADSAHLGQVIHSLLTNSLEAIEAKGAGTLDIRTFSESISPGMIPLDASGESLQPGRYVVLEIRDSGVGMDRDTLARIFEPFFSTKFTGRGLGLSAALGIVRQHRGTITAQSVPGNGSTFRIYLPALEKPPVEAAGPDPFSDIPKGAGQILVVDDEETVRTTIRRSLELWGYQVVLAENGQAALEVLPQLKPRLRAVFLDLTMPVMGGEEALRHVRRIEPDVPVILISGYAEAETMVNVSGPSSFLQKPFSAEQLGKKLCDVLQAQNHDPAS